MGERGASRAGGVCGLAARRLIRRRPPSAHPPRGRLTNWLRLEPGSRSWSAWSGVSRSISIFSRSLAVMGRDVPKRRRAHLLAVVEKMTSQGRSTWGLRRAIRPKGSSTARTAASNTLARPMPRDWPSERSSRAWAGRAIAHRAAAILCPRPTEYRRSERPREPHALHPPTLLKHFERQTWAAAQPRSSTPRR